MTFSFTDALAHVGELVFVQDFRNKSVGRPHTAKLLEVVNDKFAMIQPGGHKRAEKVELSMIKPWKKGQHEQARIRERRIPRGCIDTAALVEMARPGEGLGLANVAWWIKQGWIPENCIQRNGVTRHNYFDVDGLKRAGFFEHVRKRAKGAGKLPPNVREAAPSLPAMKVGQTWRTRDCRMVVLKDYDSQLSIFRAEVGNETMLYNVRAKRSDVVNPRCADRPDDLESLMYEISCAQRDGIEPDKPAEKPKAPEQPPTVKLPAEKSEPRVEPIPFPGVQPVNDEVRKSLEDFAAAANRVLDASPGASLTIGPPAQADDMREAIQALIAARRDLCEADAMQLEAQAKMVRARGQLTIARLRARLEPQALVARREG